jgi:hypothetical protein
MPDLYYYYGIPASETTESYTKLGWNIGAGTYVDLGIGIHIDIQLKYQNITNGIDSESKVPVFDDNGVQIDTRTIKLQGDARDFVIGVGVIFFLKD